ncbi:hypothetical protein GCM10027061_15130 [Nesterenkonia suensis]
MVIRDGVPSHSPSGEVGDIDTLANVPGTPVLSNGTYAIRSSGRGQSIYNTFVSSITLSNSATRAYVNSGSFTSRWERGGTGAVTMSDRYWANGLSVSASVPAGVSANVGSSEVVYTHSASGVSQSFMSVQGATFSGLLTAVNQSVTSQWRVGTSSYVLETH